MLPPLDRPPQLASQNEPETVRQEQSAGQKNKKLGRYGLVIIVLLVLAFLGWIGWKILPYIPGMPQYVKLKSATYLRSPHVYRYESASYDPNQAPLAPEWTALTIDRNIKQATFHSSSGDQIRVNLGEVHWVNACENQFLVETYSLSTDLNLGSLSIHNPVLIVACEMWAASEKVRPTRLVIMEGPIPEGNTFFMGMECHPQQIKCITFAEYLNELSVTVIDAGSRQPLPDAHIVLSSGLGIQEFTGSFRLPIYTAMQLEYRISMPGYIEKKGVISNFYGMKLEIMYWGTPDPARGNGDMFDLTANGQLVEYQIDLVRE